MLLCACPEPLSEGALASGNAFAIDETIVTSDATVQTFVLAQLPVDGSAARCWPFEIEGIQIAPAGQEGFRGGWALNNASAARSVNGSNARNHISLLEGYEDLVAPPWTTVGGAWPAGWAFVAPAVVGNTFQVQWNGPVGQTIRWRINGAIVRWNGATP